MEKEPKCDLCNKHDSKCHEIEGKWKAVCDECKNRANVKEE